MRYAFLSAACLIACSSVIAAQAAPTEEPRLARFEENGKWGFKDEAGNVVVKPTYDLARDFSCGLAAVNVGAERDIAGKRGGKWGYINAKGQLVIPIAFEYAHSFSEGLALVIDEKGWRYIDAEGKTAIVLGNVSGAGDFSEGLAPVQDHREPGQKTQQTRFIDKTGKTVLTVDGYAQPFHEGLAAFSIPNPEIKDGWLAGFVNRKGEVAIKPVYAEVKDFSEGLAAIRPRKTGPVYGMGDEWGYIDATGKVVIVPKFNQAFPFRDGVARVHVGGTLGHAMDVAPWWNGGEWLLIDKTGKVLKRSAEWIRDEEMPKKDAGKK